MKMNRRTMTGNVRRLLALALLAFLSVIPVRALAYAQEQSAAPPSQQTSAETKKDNAPEPKGIGGALTAETRESNGAEEEDNANLKHAAPVRWLGRKAGLSVRTAHLLQADLICASVLRVVLCASR